MITILNGKMYDNGTEVKPEFGNPEHIKALRVAGAYIEELEAIEDEEPEDSGIEVDVDITITAEIEFTCLCSKVISAEITIDYDSESELDGRRVSCRHCHRQYSLEDNGGIEAILIKK